VVARKGHLNSEGQMRFRNETQFQYKNAITKTLFQNRNAFFERKVYFRTDMLFLIDDSIVKHKLCACAKF
jgi:hypothetical protein